MDGRKVAVRETSTGMDYSVYWRFGYYKNGKLHVADHDIVSGEKTCIRRGDYAMGFDKPLIYKPNWGKLTGLVYVFKKNTEYSNNEMMDYDDAKIYRGIHHIKPI